MKAGLGRPEQGRAQCKGYRMALTVDTYDRRLLPGMVDVWNRETADEPFIAPLSEGTFQELVDVQSIGAAIQNMLLAAIELGVGSLWIADVLYAVTELKEWLGETGQLVAAVSFGMPDESPDERPRKSFDELVRVA